MNPRQKEEQKKIATIPPTSQKRQQDRKAISGKPRDNEPYPACNNKKIPLNGTCGKRCNKSAMVHTRGEQNPGLSRPVSDCFRGWEKAKQKRSTGVGLREKKRQRRCEGLGFQSSLINRIPSRSSKRGERIPPPHRPYAAFPSRTWTRAVQRKNKQKGSRGTHRKAAGIAKTKQTRGPLCYRKPGPEAEKPGRQGNTEGAEIDPTIGGQTLKNGTKINSRRN